MTLEPVSGEAPAVTVRALTKVFGGGATAYTALAGVDLDVRAREFLMLVGPSGSGKTTLLSILGCVLSATTGSALVLGRDVTTMRPDELPAFRLQKIGFIFQGHNLIAALKSRDNVALVQELRGVPRAQALKDADEMLAAVGLAGKEHSLPGDLSGGQKQRVAIARALVGAPPIVLADEPTAALDAHSGHAVIELLKALTQERGTTVICVTHDPRIFSFADRIVNIEDGLIRPDDGSHT
jgi:putative ABC transport system ATP-binding protein